MVWERLVSYDSLRHRDQIRDVVDVRERKVLLGGDDFETKDYHDS